MISLKNFSPHSPPLCNFNYPYLFLAFAGIFSFFSFVPSLQAGLYFQHALAVNSHEEDAENFAFSSMKNIFFVGATFGGVERFVLGQNIIKGNHSYLSGEEATEATFDALEMGPRMILFFNTDRTFSVSLNYNPYLKGERTLASTGESQKISGNSLYANLSYQVKFSKKVYLGASLNYHSVSIAETITNNIEAEVSQKSTSLYPAIEISVRWK